MSEEAGDLLIVIDMQNAYGRGGEWACTDPEGTADRILCVIDSGKCERVIFTRFLASDHPCGVWKDYNRTYEGVNADRIANEMMPQFAEALLRFPCYEKSVYNSLAIPQVLMAARKANRVIVCGVVAECCVLSTVFALIDEGIKTVYLTDGVSGLTKEKEAAAELVLFGLSPLHVKLMTVEEYLSS